MEAEDRLFSGGRMRRGSALSGVEERCPSIIFGHTAYHIRTLASSAYTILRAISLLGRCRQNQAAVLVSTVGRRAYGTGFRRVDSMNLSSPAS